MIYEEKTFILKNGQEAVLRSPKMGEGGIYLDFLKNICQESEFVLMYPEEIRMKHNGSKPGWMIRSGCGFPVLSENSLPAIVRSSGSEDSRLHIGPLSLSQYAKHSGVLGSALN